MSEKVIKFTQTALSQRDGNKIGKLPCDEDGYYTTNLGALNVYNCVGEYYTDEAVKLFESSSSLMRRIANGQLYAEVGHPKRSPEMSYQQFYERMVNVDPNNVCAHIKEVWLDYNLGKTLFGDAKMIVIVGKVKPSGVKEAAVKTALETNAQNVAFSVRGLTTNKYNKSAVRMDRCLDEIYTWDYVIEPGIATATKWNSPAVEQITDIIVDKKIVSQILAKYRNNPHALESNQHAYLQNIENMFKIDTGARSRLHNW